MSLDNKPHSEINVVVTNILTTPKRIQRKKISAEITRLNNLLLYSKCGEKEKIYIKQLIDKLQNEIGVYR